MQTSRRTLLKSLASAAALTLAAPLLTRYSLADDQPEKIPGADEKDPLAPQLAKLKIGIRKVSDNLYVLLNVGGNVALFQGDSGIVLIDAAVPERGKDLAAAVPLVSKSKPHLLINTHHHYDHTGGNPAIHDLGFSIVAHKNVRKHLSQRTTIEFEALKRTDEAYPEAARPEITFDDALTLHANGDTLTLTHVPPSHTDGDTFIQFEKANVIHTGDLFFNGFYPFIDYSVGGNLDGMIASEEKILALANGKTQIIPGHGPVAAKPDLQKTIDMLKTVRDKIKPLVDAKKSLEETLAAKPLAALEGKFSKGFLDDDTFTKLVYFCYTKAPK